MKVRQLLRLVLHSQPPSSISVMRARRNRAICRKGYMAIMLFGRLFTSSKEAADELNQGGVVMHHEMIHVRQAQSVFDSWLCFYLLYIYHSLLALRYYNRLHTAVYHLNPFEIEAYMYMNDMRYVSDNTRKAVRWKVFARMSLAERLKVVRSLRLV